MPPHTEDDNQIKKPYQPPCLIVYGDVREITRHNSKTLKIDNGGLASYGTA